MPANWDCPECNRRTTCSPPATRMKTCWPGSAWYLKLCVSEIVFRRHDFELHRLRVVQHVVAHLIGAPVVRRLSCGLLDAGLAFRKDPRLGDFREIFSAHCIAGGQDQHLLGLIFVVVDERRRYVADGQAVKAGHIRSHFDRRVRAVAAARAAHTGVDRHHDRIVVARQLERLGMDPRLQLGGVVHHGKFQGCYVILGPATSTSEMRFSNSAGSTG